MALPRPTRHAKSGVADSGFSTPGLDRALAILNCLSTHPSGLSLSEIAEQLGLSTNFVYRTAQSLVAHGYLLRDGEKRFTLGPGLLRLSQPFVDDVPLAEAALPAMRWLSEQTGEAAHLGVISGEEGVVLERVIGTAPIKFYVERGVRFPLHTSGPGKVMLAYRDAAERDRTIAGMKFTRFQPHTITNAKALLACLQVVRRQGWATDMGEHVEGHNCVAAPIFDADGTAIASLWITGTSQRLDAERVAKLTHVVTKAAKMASEALHPKSVLR
jgi:DNA-binding IclR family transcriptional regulator